jgi:hypothetical protein
LCELRTNALGAPPNILFAIADDWSPHAGAYGTPWVKTPAFDRVAREGLLFRRAYTPNAKCAPSRASLLTGRNPWQLEAAANHIPYFPAKFKGWCEVLAEHDWFVGHTQKGWGPGVAVDAAGIPRKMTGIAFNKRKAEPPTKEISSSDYAANFIDFLDATPPGKSWCFWYGSLEPHRGYEFRSGVTKGGKKLSEIDRVPTFWPDNETVRNDILDYAFEVEHFDSHLGRMLAELEKRGLLDNTLVIVTSDHGMPFPRGKGNAGELPNHVPLAIMWKGGVNQPGRDIDDFVSFIDIAPTLVEVAGLKWQDTGMAPSPGRSLTDIFRADKSGRVTANRDHVLIGKERNDIGRPHDSGYPIRGIISSDSAYLENFEPARWPVGNPETGYLDCDGSPTKSLILDAHRQNSANLFWSLCFGMRPSEEFYDLKADPDCVRNLAAEATRPSQLSALRERLYTELQKQGDPRMLGRGAIFDDYKHANPAHVGFYERFISGDRLQTGWVSPSDYEKPPAIAPASR